jgi:hypothetical protein
MIGNLGYKTLSYTAEGMNLFEVILKQRLGSARKRTYCYGKYLCKYNCNLLDGQDLFLFTVNSLVNSTWINFVIKIALERFRCCKFS